ncbi:MAG: hypothetical protein U0T83_00700 [Bacteriovoracaceae bacterium]
MKLLYSLKCLLLSLLLISQTIPTLGYAQAASDPECAGMYSDNPIYLENCNRCKKRQDMIWDTNQKICTKNLAVEASQNDSNACFDGRSKKDELQCLMGVSSDNVGKIDMSLGGYIDNGSSGIEKFFKLFGAYLSGYLLVEAVVFSKFPVPTLVTDSDTGISKTCQQSLQITAAYWFGLAAALTLIAGEVINYETFKAGMNELNEKFESFSKIQNQIDLQNEAFNILSLEQKILGNHLRNMSIVYLLTGALHTVAFTIAIFEMFSPSNILNQNCEVVKYDFKSFIFSSLSFFMNTSFAEDYPTAVGKKATGGSNWGETLATIIGGMGTAALLANKTIKKFAREMTRFFKPFIYGYNAFFSLWVGVRSIGEAKAVYKHAASIEDIRKGFMEKFSYKQCTADDRTNPQKPECYCYLESGEANPQRSTSAGQVCKAELEGYKLKDSGTATDYSLGLNAAGVKGCLDNNLKFDEKCKCANEVGNDGTNNCKKFNPISIPGLGGVAQYNPLLSNTNSIFNGKSSPGNLNAASIISNGGRAAIALKDFIKSNQATMLDKNIPLPPLTAQKEMFNKMEKELSTIPNINNPSSSAPYYEQMLLKNSLPKDKAEILKKIIQDNKLEEVKYKGGNAAIQNSTTKKDDFAFNLNNKSESSSGKADVKEYMDKKYKYNANDNDINKNESVPIWKILSNRYQSSGVPVLIPE